VLPSPRVQLKTDRRCSHTDPLPFLRARSHPVEARGVAGNPNNRCCNLKRAGSWIRRRSAARTLSGPRAMALYECTPLKEAYFAGLGCKRRGGVKSSSISAKLRSSCDAACIQVLAMSSNTWRCRSDLVSSAQRAHSCANSRNSLGDAAMARSPRHSMQSDDGKTVAQSSTGSLSESAPKHSLMPPLRRPKEEAPGA
jgi:hypothetical protein